MNKEAERLAQAFKGKEEVEKFIANLDRLKAEGSITEETYPSLRAEYDQRLDASSKEIDSIKGEIKKLLEDVQRERSSYHQELGMLETRYKTGELTSEQYQQSQLKLNNQIQQSNQQSDDLNRLIVAKSSADLVIPAEVADTTTKEADTITPAVVSEDRATVGAKRIKLPGRKGLIAIGALLAVIVIAVVVVIVTRGGTGEITTEETTEVAIPVALVQAANVGSLHFELVYDSTVLNATGVQAGTTLGDALLEYDITTPGRVVVGVVSGDGISGNGPAVTVAFEIESGDNTSVSIILDEVVAHDSVDLSRMSVSTVAGSLSTDDGSFQPPTIYFDSNAGQ